MAGGNGGGGALNQLNGPSNIFVDDNEDIYISDTNNHRILKWKKDSNFGIKVAGTGSMGSAINNLQIPYGVFLDQTGNVYVGDEGNHRVLKFNADNILIPATSNSATQNITSKTLLISEDNFLIAGLNPTGVSPIAGDVNANVWIDPTQGSTVKRHYEITPTANATTATGRVTLYFNQADFTDYNSQSPAPANLLPTNPTDATGIANLKIEKRSGTSSDGTGAASSYTGVLTIIDPADEDIKWDANNNRWEVSFDVTGFSGFWATGTPATALPINLISFSGKKLDHQNLLQWSTNDERNFSHFEVQSSGNSKEFTTIGTVPGATKEKYEYLDKNTSHSYYRLKLVELNGSYSYSKIIAIAPEKVNTFVVYPNPANESITLENAEKQAISVKLLDGQGREVFYLPQSISSKVLVPVQKLPAGTYFLQINSAGQNQIKKVQVNK